MKSPDPIIVQAQQNNQTRKVNFADSELIDDGKWQKSEHKVWTRELAGKKLEYFPTRLRWNYDGKEYKGKDAVEIYIFISTAEVLERVQEYKRLAYQVAEIRLQQMRDRIEAEGGA